MGINSDQTIVDTILALPEEQQKTAAEAIDRLGNCKLTRRKTMTASNNLKVVAKHKHVAGCIVAESRSKVGDWRFSIAIDNQKFILWQGCDDAGDMVPIVMAKAQQLRDRIDRGDATALEHPKKPPIMDTFKERIYDFLLSVGAQLQPSRAWHDFILETKCGPLGISIRQKDGVVFAQFDDVDRAKKLVYGVTSPSGKWNHHYYKGMTHADMAENFISSVQAILPEPAATIEPSQKQN